MSDHTTFEEFQNAVSPPGRVEMLLVIPRSTVDPNQGGGQRTTAVFEAMQELASTAVVVLGRPLHANTEDYFPGASAVIIWPEFDLSEEGSGLAQRGKQFVKKHFLPCLFYGANDYLKVKLLQLVKERNIRIVVFRLFPTFSASGMKTKVNNGPSVFVDVDDRDDQKTETRLRDLFGDHVFDMLLKRLCLRPLQRLFSSRLEGASEAWFASAEDVKTSPLNYKVIENAAFRFTEANVSSLPSVSKDIMFVGPAFFPPNLRGMTWFINNCWPLLTSLYPESRLKLVGEGNWHQCVQDAVGRHRIDVLGFVDDLGFQYGNSRLVICPLNTGGGSKVKLIEACAFGRPIVAMSHSTRGFSADLTNYILQANTGEEFVESCCRLLDRPDEADWRGQRLREVQASLYTKAAMKDKIKTSLKRAFFTKPHR